MNKVAEHPPSSPEPSSHGFHEPLKGAASRWWERPRDFPSPRTLTGLGPVGTDAGGKRVVPKLERFRARARLGLTDLDVVELSDEDDDENEPTRLLTRSLLQLPPASAAPSRFEREPLPSSAEGLAPIALDSAEVVPTEAPAAPLSAERPAPDYTSLDQLARDVIESSMLRKWMGEPEEGVAPPPPTQTENFAAQFFAESSCSPLLATDAVAPRRAAAPARVMRGPLPSWARVGNAGTWPLRLPLQFTPRRVGVAVAGLAAVALALTLLASRESGARAGDANNSRSSAPSEPASLNVRTNVPGMQVSLDGQARGFSPLLLRNLSPTTYRLKLEGNRGYAVYEQTIVLEPGKVLDIDPVLVPIRAFINIRAGTNADGAKIELIGDGRRREFRELPARIEVTPSESYRVRAQRAGHADYSAEIGFDGAELEKDVRVEFAPIQASALPLSQPSPGLPPPVPAPQPATKPNHGSSGETVVRVKPGAGSAAAGSAALSLNSIPISTVIVDGRPQGLTPRVLTVSPGPHSVVFVHPSLGRRSISVDVNGGTTAVAAVRF